VFSSHNNKKKEIKKNNEYVEVGEGGLGSSLGGLGGSIMRSMRLRKTKNII